MTQTFTVKQLRFTFTLANNATFAGTGNNVLQVTGLRATVNVQGAGSPAFPSADMQIFGMLPSDMNALISIGGIYTQAWERNNILVEANGGDGWSTVFAGSIVTASPDYTGAPDVFLGVQAQMLGFESVNPATPTSFQNATTVATVVSQIAAKMGAAFENNGVTTQVPAGAYYWGSATDQLRAVCKHFSIDCYTEAAVGGASSLDLGAGDIGSTTLIAICPKGVARNTPVWNIDPSSGLVGYPRRNSQGFVTLTTEFNPSFRFGGIVNISKSGLADIPGQTQLSINGQWLINGFTHRLESVKFEGAWFSDILCYPPNTQLGLATS